MREGKWKWKIKTYAGRFEHNITIPKFVTLGVRSDIGHSLLEILTSFRKQIDRSETHKVNPHILRKWDGTYSIIQRNKGQPLLHGAKCFSRAQQFQDPADFHVWSHSHNTTQNKPNTIHNRSSAYLLPISITEREALQEGIEIVTDRINILDVKKVATALPDPLIWKAARPKR